MHHLTSGEAPELNPCSKAFMWCSSTMAPTCESFTFLFFLSQTKNFRSPTLQKSKSECDTVIISKPSAGCDGCPECEEVDIKLREITCDKNGPTVLIDGWLGLSGLNVRPLKYWCSDPYTTSTPAEHLDLSHSFAMWLALNGKSPDLHRPFGAFHRL